MMTFNLICIFMVFFVMPNISAEKHQTHQGSKHIDSLLESLEYEEWRGDEQLCKKATFELLHGVRNRRTWATWMNFLNTTPLGQNPLSINVARRSVGITEQILCVWDSMQLPVAVLYGSRHHLGSFEQCLEDPWSMLPTQYCLLDVKLREDTREYEEVDPRSDVKEFVGIKTKFGNRRLNFYSQGVCLPAVCSPSSVAKISRHIHQLSHLPFGDVTLEPRNCQVKNRKTEFTMGFYAFWAIIIVTTGIATTIYIVEDSITNPKLIKLANWFSPSKNFESLLKINKEELMSLNGLRTFCSGTAVVLHYYLSVALLAMINPADAEKSLKTVLGMFLPQLAMIIDAFFVMSGLLHMKGLLTQRSGLLQMLWKRYIRLVVPLALNLLFVSAVLPHTVSGPLQPMLVVEQAETSARNWWKTLLMINNFVGTNEICPFFTWYLSCDFQLAILGSILFWLCQRWTRPIAVRLCAMVYLASLIVPAAWTYWRELPPILAYDVDMAIENHTNRVFQTTYIKPYSRASAYLIGLGMGYILHVYKPNDYRKTIPQTWSILGGVLSLLTMLLVMGAGGALNAMEYNVLHTTLYSVFNRSIFAIGVCLLIAVTEYGTFPIIGDFLSSPVFVSLSRLTYGTCLYHPIILWQNLYSTQAPLTYNFFHLFVNAFGYIAVSAMFSYLLWFIVDAPVMNITNTWFKNRSSDKISEQKSTENGKLGNGVCEKTEKQM